MKLIDFSNYIYELFDKTILDEFTDEWGFTYKTDKEIKRIGFATNLTPDTISEAIKNNVDFILTHHDVWDFMFGMKDHCLKMLKESGISHYFIHLPLDAAEFGTSASLAKKLGLNILEKSALYDGLYCGRIGEFEKPLEFDQFVKTVETILEEPVKAWKNNDRLVKRVGIVTGGGGMTTEVKDAVDRQCDLYLTGEKYLYSIEYAKFAGIDLVVGSHTFTEIFGVKSLAEIMKDKFNHIEVIQLKEAHLE